MAPPQLASLPPRVDLSKSDASELVRGRPAWLEILWYLFGSPLIQSRWIVSSRLRVLLLRAFGARIGREVVMRKAGLDVKFPWKLEIGDNTWIGANVKIDNLAAVRIGANVVVSNDVYLCTGNHDYSDPHMRLFVQPVALQDGCWVAVRAVVCPGVTVGEGAVLAAGSVANRNVPPFEIHGGNPAVFVRRRNLRHPASVS